MSQHSPNRRSVEDRKRQGGDRNNRFAGFGLLRGEDFDSRIIEDWSNADFNISKVLTRR
jgi:hypothetical protein